MSTLLEIVNPSYLLFPALVGTMIMGLVCPLVGSYLVLRRTVFLGLTLPEIAAAGVAFTFWLQQAGVLAQLGQTERGIAMVGSLAFTFLGMGLLGYLEQRGKGLAEGRLAAAYALAGGLTILFMVFNPAGQIEVLNLLKGEVIALSQGEIRLLVTVFGLVLLAMLIFRREFLLTSFVCDLAFPLKDSRGSREVIVYLLAGLISALRARSRCVIDQLLKHLASLSEEQHRFAFASAVKQSAKIARRDGRKDFVGLPTKRDGSVAGKFAAGTRAEGL